MNTTTKEIYPGLSIDIKKWACKTCTFENMKHYNICEMCHNESDTYNFVNTGEYRQNINKIEKVTKVFGKTNKIILPVLSCYTEEQFMQNINNLYPFYKENQISGVWIMTSNSTIKSVHNVIKWIKNEYPNFWVGANLIGENIFDVFKFLKETKPDGIWIDNSYLNNSEDYSIPNMILDQFERINWHGLYFGGVMFKYQSNNNDMNKEIIKNAHRYVDVLTTSGVATGVAIEPSKIISIHEIVKNDVLIAVASGITAYNLNTISNECSIYIIRTSIVDQNNNIDLIKLKKIIN